MLTADTDFGELIFRQDLTALQNRFPDWDVHVSPRISLPEYASQFDMDDFLKLPRVSIDEYLHLAVSMRSFRAEKVSELVGHILDNEPEFAKAAFESIQSAYPVYLTRDLAAARAWLRGRARGTERFGLIASSGAQCLRPEGIHIKAEIESANWFLNDSADVRSSYYLEDVATEFAVQGLELDWVVSACPCDIGQALSPKPASRKGGDQGFARSLKGRGLHRRGCWD